MPKQKKIISGQEKSVNAKSGMPKQVSVHHIKTSNYRTFYIDGIFGGITPNGKIYAELFLQRQVTPQIIEHKVNADGNLGEEIQRIGKQGIVREIESGIIMDVPTAKLFRDWLDSKISEFAKVSRKK